MCLSSLAQTALCTSVDIFFNCGAFFHFHSVLVVFYLNRYPTQSPRLLVGHVTVYVVLGNFGVCNLITRNHKGRVFETRLRPIAAVPMDKFHKLWLPWATHWKVWHKWPFGRPTRWPFKRPIMCHTFLCVAQGKQSMQNSSMSIGYVSLSRWFTELSWNFSVCGRWYGLLVSLSVRVYCRNRRTLPTLFNFVYFVLLTDHTKFSKLSIPKLCICSIACLKVSGYEVIGRARGDLEAKFAVNVQV